MHFERRMKRLGEGPPHPWDMGPSLDSRHRVRSPHTGGAQQCLSATCSLPRPLPPEKQLHDCLEGLDLIQKTRLPPRTSHEPSQPQSALSSHFHAHPHVHERPRPCKLWLLHPLQGQAQGEAHTGCAGGCDGVDRGFPRPGHLFCGTGHCPACACLPAWL